jgi:CRP-like cAMP-binding protein
MDPLERETSRMSVLSPGVMKTYIDAWQYWTVPKDHYLVREHEVCDYIFFIRKGIARIYYYKNDKEISEWFATDEQFFLSIISFFERTPSRLIIQTLEPAEVMGIHHNDLMRLAAEYHEVETLFRKMMCSSLILSQIRMDSIQFETAQQRYEGLVKNSPEIIKRVPLSYIASYLGVTLETLSRIRSGK